MTSNYGGTEFKLQHDSGVLVLTMVSDDGMNRLTRRRVIALQKGIEGLVSNDPVLPLIISGDPIFSSGADLKEISALSGPNAFEFARMGQELMRIVEAFPAPVCAAISGYCMGGGLDLALACDFRIASPRAVFGHRGAALGLITGWGGTQRLPRLIGKGLALEMLVAAEKVPAHQAMRTRLIDGIADDPVTEAVHRITALTSNGSLFR
jgi:enoyl-CoA hydratase